MSAIATHSILPLALETVGYNVAGRSLLRDISARFHVGGPSIILGPNGSGKSLTLRLAHGLLEPTRGRVRWSETGGAEPGRRQAMVFERPVLLRRSVIANVEYALALRGLLRSSGVL